MEPTETRALEGLARRHFSSFAEAAEAVLDALGEAVPGTVVLAEADPAGNMAVTEIRGPALPALGPGSLLPTREGEYGRQPLGRSAIASDIVLSSGGVVGVLLAVDPRDGAYGDQHRALIGVGARLLGSDWENVRMRSELRRLRMEARDRPRTDPITGFANRRAFLELVEHQRRLVQRGTLTSMLIACRVGLAPDGNGGSDALRKLAFKEAAEVFGATARETDHLGRLDDDHLCAVLIGCDEPGAEAFLGRFRLALERTAEARQAQLEVSCGFSALGGTDSPEQAIENVTAATGNPPRAPTATEPSPAAEVATP
ncbi:MAG: hypothetical protein U0R52_00235 [Solirubrobacterales bacterium]